MRANLYLPPRKQNRSPPFLEHLICANSLKIFAKQILRWYGAHKRDLPWRETRDPYKIWLSEIILQQTRVTQGLPYYRKFIEAFPGVDDLAAAPLDRVLRLWQGLGYYSRARNLHACAQQVVEEYDGVFPTSAKELQKLKGVGPYTASAIASMAFDEKVPVVDGNVYRVLARLNDDDTDISSSTAYRHFYNLALQIISEDEPGEFNQAMMEFGATHCTPKSPLCEGCIFQNSCLAYQNGTVAQRPVKLKKVKVTHRSFHYLIFQYNDQVLVRQRVGKDIWQGLHDFYCIEGDLDQEGLLSRLAATLGDEVMGDYILENQSTVIKHVLTHQRIAARFYRLRMASEEVLEATSAKLGLMQVEQAELDHLAKPILIENYLKNGALSLF